MLIFPVKHVYRKVHEKQDLPCELRKLASEASFAILLATSPFDASPREHLLLFAPYGKVSSSVK